MKFQPYKSTFLLLILIAFVAVIHAREATPPEADVQSNDKSVVVIDPGHGGGDWGVTVRGTHEKDITIKIAMLVKEKLKKDENDITVIMTREDDTFLRIEERAGLANSSKANLYISIHCDYVPFEDISGYRVYYYDGIPLSFPEDEFTMRKWNDIQRYHLQESKRAAVYIMQYMQAALIPEESTITGDQSNDLVPFPFRGEMSVRSYSLTGFDMPAVLVETGNLNNKIDVSYLKDEKSVNAIAYHIAEGIHNYFKDMNVEAYGAGEDEVETYEE